jgi:hypothetical protein
MGIIGPCLSTPVHCCMYTMAVMRTISCSARIRTSLVISSNGTEGGMQQWKETLIKLNKIEIRNTEMQLGLKEVLAKIEELSSILFVSQ